MAVDTVSPSSNAAIIEESLRNLLRKIEQKDTPTSLSEADSMLSTCLAIRSAVMQIRSSVLARYNAQQQVHNLPPEILEYIFQLVLDHPEFGYVRRPTTYFDRQQALRRTSSHWNQIILSSPYFWNTIVCTDFPKRRFDIALEKSGNAGLHVICRSSDHCSQFADRMEDEMHRWASLDIKNSSAWAGKLECDMPRLTNLRVNGDGSALPVVWKEHGPYLSLGLYHATDVKWESALTRNLYALELVEATPSLKLDQLLDIVESNPRLERLVLGHISGAPSNTTPHPKVHSPNLQYISAQHYVTSEATVDFLSSLVTPLRTVVHFSMYAGETTGNIPLLLAKLFSYFRERIQQLSETEYPISIEYEGSNLSFKCPAQHPKPILKVNISWWLWSLSAVDGLKTIAENLEPLLCGQRSLWFPTDTSSSSSTYSGTNPFNVCSQALPRLSNMTMPCIPFTVEHLAKPKTGVSPGSAEETHPKVAEEEAIWSFPGIEHLCLNGGKWVPELLDLVQRRKEDPNVKTVQSIVLRNVEVDDDGLTKMKEFVPVVEVC